MWGLGVCKCGGERVCVCDREKVRDTTDVVCEVLQVTCVVRTQ